MIMSFAEYAGYDALGLAKLVREAEVTPQELLQVAQLAARKIDPELSFLVAETAGYAEQQCRRGLPDGPFSGVPFLRKDTPGAMRGIPTDAGCKLGEGLTSDAIDNMMSRLLQTGLVIFGRSSAPSFSASITTEPAYRQPTRNPWNKAHSPAGSSGGSAAAVAAGVVPIAQAGDAGGSTRVPAHATGTFGFKPSRNLVPIGPFFGESAFGFSVAGVITRTVRDTAATFDAIAGPDSGCRYYTPKPEQPFLDLLGHEPKKLRIAVNRRPMNGGAVEATCLEAVDGAASLLSDMGHCVEEVDAPTVQEGFVNAMLTTWSAYVAAGVDVLERSTGRFASADTLEPSIFAMSERGRRHSALDVLAALDEVNVLSRAFGTFFEKWDMILEPVSQKLAPAIGDIPGNEAGISAEDFFAYSMRYMGFSMRINAIGVPAVSVPWLVGDEGLPANVHLIAPFGNDALCLQMAHVLEQANPWVDRRPPIHVCSDRVK